jgi:uncharacterized protein YjiS (DUF1127 family)
MPTAAVHTLINSQCDRPHGNARISGAMRSVGRTLRLWRRRYRERHVFPVLDERDLRDLRLTRWDVERELTKPFWRG